MNKKNRGISLIVLVITIIVIIVLAGAVILNLTNNNPMDSAKKATFLNDLDTFKSELSLYQGKRYSDSVGEFEPTLLQADETSITYGSVVDATKTIKDIITSLGNTEKYSGQFIVIDGKLVYQGADAKKQDWARDNGTEVLIVGEPEVTILSPIDSVFKQGADIVYIVKFNSNAALTTVDLAGKVEVLDDKDVALTTQPNITIGTVSGTSLDAIRQVDVTIETDTLENGSYKLKIKEGAVTNANNMSNSFDKISLLAFDIDNTAPENPVMLATPTTPTNGSVSVAITYSEDTQVKEYSFDTTLWQTYTSPVVVSNNGITVYARGKDLVGNETGVATITVSNIDKISPTVAYGTNGATNIKTASTTVTISDVSGLNTSTLQYVWDTQTTTTPSSGWVTFTNGQAITKSGVTGVYYLWIKASDNAGNSVVSKTNVFVIDNTNPTVVFGTNGGTNLTSLSTTITVSDLGSGLNTSTLQYVWDTQKVTTPSSGWTVFTNGSTQTKAVEGTYYLWVKATDKAGNIFTTVSNLFVVGDIPIPISTVQSVNKTFAGATTGFSYNNPVIPAGFVAANTTDASWNNLSTDWNKGLVIQDSNGNQFIWVPVDGTNVAYAKWCTTGVSYLSTSEDTTPLGFSTTNITTKYKGFYIARYESAFDYNGGNIRVASKKSSNKTTSDWSTIRNATYNGYLWNYINYTDSKTYAENMDTSYGYNTSLIGTNLITGTQWDTTVKWIQNSGINVTDSRTWGNYNNSISPANISGYANLQVSGYSNYWKAKNIYDLAGNLMEWTNEITSSYRIFRGGAINCPGDSYPVAHRNWDVPGNKFASVSFRVALYVL